jgi:hypothetical protein
MKWDLQRGCDGVENRQIIPELIMPAMYGLFARAVTESASVIGPRIVVGPKFFRYMFGRALLFHTRVMFKV